MKKSFRAIPVLLSIFFTSCATYAPQYRDKEAVPVFPSDKEIEKTFYLIGDAGYSDLGAQSQGLQIFQNFMKTQKTTGNYAIFLGDNIYPVGMPPAGHPEREASEWRLDAQYIAVRDYDGELIFIPGNHDWYNEGLLGLKRQEVYFESLLRDPDVFQPNNGCPLVSREVTPRIQLILIDTQWYLENWNLHPTINEFCDIKTREKFFIDVELELEKHKGKTIVFAMHHPMFTNGSHGGFFAAEKHLYPTQRKLPLPGLASLVAQIRAQGGVSVQDRYNELYNKLMNRLAAIAKRNDRLVFVSGHEHTLQHIEKDGLIQMVSGAGAKGSFAALGKTGEFSYGGQGFAVLHVFEDGSSWVRYFGGDDNNNPILLFEKEVIGPLKKYNPLAIEDDFPDTVTTAIYQPDSIREALYLKTVWGQKYKNAYTQPVKAKVGKLDSIFGGLEVISEGSGADFRSLKLRDSIGNEYRMRALKKNALQYVQEIAFENPEPDIDKGAEKNTISLPDNFDINFYTATHPYALLAIPDMAEAINIFYTSPQLFYVPKQERLKNYNDHYGDALYFISIEPTEDIGEQPKFRYADDIETTDDILIRLRKKGEIFVDESNYLRSRLFDMLIGDWDREPDHWRWAEYFNRDSLNVLVPIPKNRDDAFSSVEGNILDVARSIFGGTLQRHIYNDDLTDLEWFNEEAVILDRALLERSGKNQWEFIAEFIQEQISDAVIERAFEKVPPEVRDESLDEIIKKLKSRRDNLVSIAGRYYDFLATLQTITATDFSDWIEITRLPEGETGVKVFRTENGVKTEQYIDRVFRSEETKEVWIYGLSGNDIFEVNGETKEKASRLRIIGGQGEDAYIISNGARVRIYDHESRPNVIGLNEGANVRFTDVYELNSYDHRKQIRRKNAIAAAIGYNPDDGFRTGLQYIYQINGFQRNPFSQNHVFTGAYFTDIDAIEVTYDGEFSNVMNNLNLNIGARITSPNYRMNFFGFGNETNNPQAQEGYDYNRVKVQTLSVNAGILRNSNFGSFFKLQGTVEAISVDEAPLGLLSRNDLIGETGTKYFGTLEAIYNYRSYDTPRNPSRGMMFDLSVGGTDNFEALDRLFGFLITRLGFYNAIANSGKWVLKTNIRAGFNFGNSFEFYQGIYLGGDTGLRGFREERFTGKTALAGSADLRYSFNEFKIGYIPLQIGVYGGTDLGRVWIPSETSQKWHNSFGGGLWINGPGDLNAEMSVFTGNEGPRYAFGVGFSF